MTIFRWIVGALTALMGAGAVLAFAVFMLRDDEAWITLARRLRQWTWLLLLFWFNSEIWGQVIYTLVSG